MEPLTFRAAIDDERSTVTLCEGDESRTYALGDERHETWIELFRNVADDFGTRLPRTHQRLSPEPGADLIEPLLTRNIAPGIRDGYGDPAVLRTRGGWHLVVTSNDAPDAFPILRSPDLRHWEHLGFVFARGSAPVWAMTGENDADFWAPELHRIGDGHWLCFTARNKDRELCIGLARSVRPDGPFTADPEPLLTGGVIDAHLFARPGQAPLLFWKEDTNAIWPRLLASLLDRKPEATLRLFDADRDRRTARLSVALWRWARRASPTKRFFVLQPLIEAVVENYETVRERLQDHAEIVEAMRTPVYAQQLSPDGSRLTGERRIVLVNDLAWEGHLIEGNWVTEQGGRFYLFYSGNDFSTPDYGIGVAIADDPLGPYRKAPEPLLRTTDRWWGPGHPSVAPGPDGIPRLFFHGFPPGTGGYRAFRALLSVRLAFHSDRVELIGPQ